MKSLGTYIAHIREDFAIVAGRAGTDPLLSAAKVLLYIVLIGLIVTQIVIGIGLAVQAIGLNSALLTSPLDPIWRPVWRLVLGLVALGLLQTIVEHLLAMIRSVARDEAFAPPNVGRLEKIAWHVLGLQVLGTFARLVRLPLDGDIAGLDTGVAISPAGIAFALLLFILARVFRQGAAMREDLEGTV